MQATHFPFHLSETDVYYLEMNEVPSYTADAPESAEIRPFTLPCSADAYRKLYFGVGEKWNWLDRMVMPDSELLEMLSRPGTEIFTLGFQGQTAGFVEFVVSDTHTEIQYFGLFPSFIGKGLGGYFLRWSVLKAWEYGKVKVQVNTCALDHPAALTNYLKAGFELVQTRKEWRKIAE